LALILYFICFKGTKEIVQNAPEKQSIKEMLGCLKGNTPAWILGFAFLVQGVFLYGRMGSFLYYFTYNAG
ncbi:hypothetical protein V7075_26150, partial [Neobacillus drentensis]